jgi:hypothetical protein
MIQNNIEELIMKVTTFNYLLRLKAIIFYGILKGGRATKQQQTIF